jgi:3-hydroxybutyryl-CoA dehydrogenase
VDKEDAMSQPPSEPRSVAVLGFGTMGSGIVQVCAQAGHPVTVLETDRERLDAGRARLEGFLAGGVARGKLSGAEREAVLGRVTATTSVAELAGADLVIEAVVEDAGVKKPLLAEVAGVVGEHALIATNTSALSVTDLATAVPAPERFAGLHFFNPAPVMKLVEIVRSLQSSPETITRLEEFTTSLGKTAVTVKDRPGFLVNRLLMPYLNDVITAYDEGLATARDIDVALELGLGYPKGPLALLDLIGLDTHEHATRNAYEQTLDPQFAPPPLLTQMVAAGYLGDKTGTGFRTQEDQ